MRLTVEDGKIVVNPRTSEQRRELLKLAEGRVPIDFVRAEYVKMEKRAATQEDSSSSI